jgi:hypothetical protein
MSTVSTTQLVPISQVPSGHTISLPPGTLELLGPEEGLLYKEPFFIVVGTYLFPKDAPHYFEHGLDDLSVVSYGPIPRKPTTSGGRRIGRMLMLLDQIARMFPHADNPEFYKTLFSPRHPRDRHLSPRNFDRALNDLLDRKLVTTSNPWGDNGKITLTGPGAFRVYTEGHHVGLFD